MTGSCNIGCPGLLTTDMEQTRDISRCGPEPWPVLFTGTATIREPGSRCVIPVSKLSTLRKSAHCARNFGLTSDLPFR